MRLKTVVASSSTDVLGDAVTLCLIPSAAAVRPRDNNLDKGHDPGVVPLLLAIAKSTRQLMTVRLAQLDLVPGQDQLLDVLHAAEAASVNDVADALSVRAATVSKMLDHLEEKGLAVRQRDRQDMRRVVVHLTASGTALQMRVRDVWNALERDLLINSGSDLREAAMLLELAQVNAILSRQLSRSR